MTKTMLSTEEDRGMWKRLFEDCNKKQGEEIEPWRREYRERSERLALTTAVEKVIPTRNNPRGQSPMELLTPRELSRTTETRLPATTGRVTIPDPIDTLGDPVVEQTVRKLIQRAGRLVANRNAPVRRAELEEYSPFELGSIISRSKRTELRKKVRRNV